MTGLRIILGKPIRSAREALYGIGLCASEVDAIERIAIAQDRAATTIACELIGASLDALATITSEGSADRA